MDHALNKHLAAREADEWHHEQYIDKYLDAKRINILAKEMASITLFGGSPHGENDQTAVSGLAEYLAVWLNAAKHKEWGGVELLSALIDNYEAGQTFEEFCEPDDPPDTP